MLEPKSDHPMWRKLQGALNAVVRAKCKPGGYHMVTVRLLVKDRQLVSFAKPSIQTWATLEDWEDAAK